MRTVQVGDALAGGGEMGGRVRAFDWSRTALGPIESWPPSLRTAVGIVLSSAGPMYLAWGPRLVQLYNDAFRPFVDAGALGREARTNLRERWDDVGPAIEGVLAAGEAPVARDVPVPLHRPEDRYLDLAVSAVRDERGGVGGVLVTGAETTARVVGERRMATLRALAAVTGTDPDAAAAGVAAALAGNPADLPFTLVYLVEDGGRRARLAGLSGLEPDGPASLRTIPAAGARGWPLDLAAGQPIVLEDVVARFGDVRAGPWPEPVSRAIVLPLGTPVTGLLVVGLGQRRPLDADYRAFLELVAGQAAAAVAGARANKWAVALPRLERALVSHTGASSDTAAFFGDLTAAVAGLLRARRAVFWLLDPVAETLTAQRAGHGFSSRAMSLMRGEPNAAAPDLLRRMGVRDAITAPWRAGDLPLGVLAAYDSLRPRGFNAEDEAVLRLAAQVAALAWQQRLAGERERSIATEESRSRELAVVRQASRALTASPDLEAVCAAVAQATVQVVSPPGVRSRRAAVLRFDGTRLTVVAEHDPEGPRLEGAAWEPSQYAEVRRILESGKPMPRHFTAERDMPEVTRDVARWTGVQSVAMVALNVANEPFGVLSVGARDATGFSEGQLREIETIANLAELAISNAMHVETVRSEAERVTALEETKSKFLRLASHELRGPVAVLRGYLSMLQDGTFGSPDETIAGVYEVMAAKAAQMEMLVTQMLEAARLEGGRLRLRLETVDLRAAVIEAFETVRLLATTRHEMGLEQPDEPVVVTGDPWRLTTIVGNLLDNAVKYSPEGGPVRCCVRVEDGWAQVEVSDRGLGIAPEDMPILFTRFGRIVTPENSHILGTGLGLYLCQELAHMHNGELDAASTPGAGSVFRLRMPLAAADEQDATTLDRVFDRD